MSEKQAKRKRVNAKMAYVIAFEVWLDEEPPMINFFKWRRWKKSRPVRPLKYK